MRDKREIKSLEGISLAGADVYISQGTSAPSLFTFRKRLKLHLFSLSYPGLAQ